MRPKQLQLCSMPRAIAHTNCDGIYCRAAFILAALRQIHTFSLPAGCDVPRPPTRVLLLNNMVGAGDVDEDVSSRATEGDKRSGGGGLVGSTSRTWKKKQQRRPANMES